MPITEGGRFSPENRIVSPGVFTRENDLSGVAQGVADIGAVIVAPFPKGPGFSPTLLTNVNDLQSKFGIPDGTYYGPYTATEYLKQKGFVTVVRVGALTGYNQNHPLIIYANQGRWQRNDDQGCIAGNSFISPSGSYTSTASAWPQGITLSSLTSSSIAPYSGSVTMTFSNPSFNFTFVSGAGSLTTNIGNIISASVINGVTASVTASTILNYVVGASISMSGFTNGYVYNNASATVITSNGASFSYVTGSGTLSSSISGSTIGTSTVTSNLDGKAINYSPAAATSTLGSTLFNGQVVSFTNTGTTYAATVIFTSSAQIPTTSSLSWLFASGSIATGYFASTSSLLGGTDPFDYVIGGVDPAETVGPLLISSSFTIQTNNGCSSPTFQFNAGSINGNFGKYNGTFISSGAPTLDNCGNLLTGSGVTKILAILADTQASSLDATLTSPGFSGSTLQSSSVLYNNSSSIYQDYILSLSSSLGSGWAQYEFSLNPGDNKYIANVFGTNPTAGNPATQVQGQKIEAAYIYSIFQDTIAEVNANPDDWQVQVAAPIQLGTIFSGSIAPMTFTDTYSLQPTKGDSAFALNNANTPFISSQAIAGINGKTTRFQLFQVMTLGDGTNTNTSYKIEISNVKLAGTVPGSTWGSFTLAVRDYSDTENRPKYLEQFQNLTLDPTSPDFIARRIGDTYSYILASGKILEFGTFKNLSKYIRISMSTNNYPVSAVPAGFEPYQVPFGGLALDQLLPPMMYTKASTWTNGPGRYASGVVFGQTLSSDSELTNLYPVYADGNLIYQDNLQYFAPLPANTTIGSNIGFYLDVDYTGSVPNTTGSVHALPFTSTVGISSFLSQSAGTLNAIPYTYNAANEATYVKMRKFVLGFQSGFDGQSPAIPINVGSNIIAGNTQGFNCATSTTAGSVAYNQCLGALSNADQFDINLLVTPGIFHSLHSYVAQLGIDLCEQRGDCFYIMDNIVFPNTNQPVDMITAAINDVSTIDSNYVGTYYPWLKVLDTNINQIVNLPPSVLMPAIYASNDAASAEWFAPAGLNRGGIPQATGVLDRLTIADRDNLYLGRVNPIASFPGQGICVWGQKTLQIKHSALDRINVRRLLIALKKFIAASSKYLVFEQNVATTRNRFLSIVNPYLESVQQRSGLYAYKVVMDETNNTADIIDNNQLYGQIYLQPAKTAEFIILDFNILPTGGAVFGS